MGWLDVRHWRRFQAGGKVQQAIWADLTKLPLSLPAARGACLPQLGSVAFLGFEPQQPRLVGARGDFAGPVGLLVGPYIHAWERW